MPINRRHRVRTRSLLEQYATRGIETVSVARTADRYQISLVLFGCVSNDPPGPCPLDPTFECELDVGDIGLLVEYHGSRNCQGICELSISDVSPGWLFRQNRERMLRLPILSHGWRPVRQPRGSLIERFMALCRQDSKILDPEVIPLVVDSVEPRVPAQIDVTLVMEFTSCVVGAQSVLNIPADQPLPEGGDLAVLKLQLRAYAHR